MLTADPTHLGNLKSNVYRKTWEIIGHILVSLHGTYSGAQKQIHLDDQFKSDYYKRKKNYYVVGNAGCARSRNT